RVCLRHIQQNGPRRITREILNTHGLSRNHINYGIIKNGLQKFGVTSQLFSRMMISPLQLSKIASNTSWVAIQQRRISRTDMAARTVENNLSFSQLLPLPHCHDKQTNISHRHVCDTEAHNTPRNSFTQCFIQ
ncbi:hypothetical protein J0S82_010911, partial [Galemys pyrenaicus]